MQTREILVALVNGRRHPTAEELAHLREDPNLAADVASVLEESFPPDTARSRMGSEKWSPALARMLRGVADWLERHPKTAGDTLATVLTAYFRGFIAGAAGAPEGA